MKRLADRLLAFGLVYLSAIFCDFGALVCSKSAYVQLGSSKTVNHTLPVIVVKA